MQKNRKKEKAFTLQERLFLRKQASESCSRDIKLFSYVLTISVMLFRIVCQFANLPIIHKKALAIPPSLSYMTDSVTYEMKQAFLYLELKKMHSQNQT